MKKAIIMMYAALAVLLVAVGSYAAELKIGVIDINYILKNSQRVLSAKGELKSRFDKLQADLSEKEKALQKKKDDFDTQKLIYSAEVKRAKEIELKEEESKLVNTLKEYQNNIQKSEQELIKGVIDEIKNISAQDKSYDLIVEKSTMIYAVPELEVTKKFLELYDSAKK